MMAASTGIRQRHGRACKAKVKCSCPWRAEVYSPRDGKKIRRSFPTKAAALAWRDEAKTGVRKKVLRAPVPITLDDAAQAWLDGARKGLIHTRSEYAYKPAAIRAYEAALRLRVLPEFGHRKLSDISRDDLQDFVAEMKAKGLNVSTIGGTIVPLRAIYRRALERSDSGIVVNPTAALGMPKAPKVEKRVAPPAECGTLLKALPEQDRPLWATAMYAGLRRGELAALRIESVDLAAGTIDVRRGWDYVAGEIATKSGKARKVPIAAILRDYLDEHLLSLEWDGGLIFGATASRPFAPTPLEERAKRAWKAAGINSITLHECRHTFASLMIDANVNAKALSTYMGHANISITMDLYGHLFPGNEAEAAGLLDAYLARADTAARLAQIEG